MAEYTNVVQIIQTLVWIIIVVACLVPIIFFMGHRWFGNPSAKKVVDKHLVKSPTRPGSEMHTLRRGQSITMGLNAQTHQEHIMPEANRNVNVLIVGPVKSGKTRYMVDTFIAQDIAHGENSIVVFDGNQGDITELVLGLCDEYHREYVILPDVGYNPLRSTGDIKEYARFFADLLELMQQKVESPYHLDMKQQFVRYVIPLYPRTYKQPMILQELKRLCQYSEFRERLLRDAGSCPEATEYRAAFHLFEKNQKALTEELAQLASFCDDLTLGINANLYNQRLAPTLAEYIEQKKVIIIREGAPEGDTRHAAGIMFMLALQEYATLRSPDPQNFLVDIYMDEAPYFFHKNYKHFIATARKKRIAQHLGFQTFAQLDPYRNEIKDNTRTWIIMGGLGYEDAQLVSDTVGKRLHENSSQSHSLGLNTGPGNESIRWDWEYLIQPHVVSDMGEDEALVLTLEGEKRQKAAPIWLQKPDMLPIQTVYYQSPTVTPYPLPTIWEEQDTPPDRIAGQP